MIYQGTTQQHIIKLPIVTDLIEKLEIYYSQNGVLLFEKTLNDCIVEENKITVSLTQEETLRFNPGLPAQVQVRYMTKENEVITSKIGRDAVYPILKKAVLE